MVRVLQANNGAACCGVCDGALVWYRGSGGARKMPGARSQEAGSRACSCVVQVRDSGARDAGAAMRSRRCTPARAGNQCGARGRLLPW